MLYKLKRFIRDNLVVMYFLSAIYRVFCINIIKKRNGLKIKIEGVFLKKCKIINHGSNNTLNIGIGCRLSYCRIQFFGDNNHIIIENDCVADAWIFGLAAVVG